jgi:hypothetical protein
MHDFPVHPMDYVGPALGAVVFVLLMSLVEQPARRSWNALLVAGASGVYLSGGLGPGELLFPALLLPVAHRGLRSYRFIGVAWLMHSAWDVVHHLYGRPIWPFMATSSFGCMIFDALIAVWFLAGAPSIFRAGAAPLTAPCDAPPATAHDRSSRRPPGSPSSRW